MEHATRRLGQATALTLAAVAVGCAGLEATKPLNAPPAFASTPPKTLPDGKPVKPGLAYLYQASATDPDPGDSPTIRLISAPANATFANNALRWVPSMDQTGLEQVFILEASDGKDTTRQTWSVTPQARTAPTDMAIAPVGTANPTELHQFAWTVAFKDDDPTSVTIRVISPAGAAYAPALQTLYWTPPQGATSATVQLEAVNNVGLTAQQSLPVTIDRNKAPLITFTGSNPASVVEGDFFSAPFTVADPNGDAITASQVQATVTYQGNPVFPAPQTTWDSLNGRATVTWTPNLNAVYRGKTVSVNLSAADAFGAANTLSVPLLVSANQPPAITGDSGNPGSVQAGTFLSHRYTISDPNGDAIDAASVTAAITYLGAAVTPAPSLVWDAVAGRATVTWAPAVAGAYVGHTVTLTLSAKDTKGATGTLDVAVSVTP